jgi:uracil-DNA glycosylase
MPWTERQLAMLEVMGLRMWRATAVAADPPPRAMDTGTAAASAASTSATTATARAAADGAVAARAAASAGGSPAPAGAPAGAAPAAALTAETGAVPPVTPGAGRGRIPPGPMPKLPSTAADASAVVERAPRPEVAGLAWSDLREAVAACRACRLCDSRTQTVFGVGSEQAHWMVVGEAPGEQEDRQGEPFVGAAGQLLDRMLAALNLTRAVDGPAPPSQRVYIANTLKCRPPRNRNPNADELAQCEPYLVRQIELLRPRLILAMGRFAVRSLLKTEDPVGRLRGRVHRYHGVPLVVTYHPAYLLRNLVDKARAWEDLCLAAQVVEAAEAD